MSEMTIRTNHHHRPLLSGWELTPEERAELDYVASAVDEDAWCNEVNRFFRYRGQIYDMHEFSRIIPPDSVRCHPMECAEPSFQGWDGYASDSYFSGTLVKYPKDDYGLIDDVIVVGVYLS